MESTYILDASQKPLKITVGDYHLDQLKSGQTIIIFINENLSIRIEKYVKE